MDMLNNDIGFIPDLPKGKSSIIKVLGVGGGGNNALKHMYEKGINGVDFIILNTDQQALDDNPIANKVQLGVYTTEGLGAGADPEVGEKAALESIDDIKTALGNNTKMVFITTGMGGGTGTGAAPVIAKVAKELGILTVAIVTMPFGFEGKRRKNQAEAGIEKLKQNVDSLIIINNDKVVEQFPDLDFDEAFLKADDILMNAAKGMAEMVSKTFYINVDFRDANTVLQNSGTALMSIGIASGENRASEAVKKALDSPLLNNSKIKGAKNVLVLIQAGAEHKPKISELNLIPEYIQSEAGGDNDANVIWGAGIDEELGESIKVLVIATGFSDDETEKIIEEPKEEPVIEKPKVIVTLGDNDEEGTQSQSFSAREIEVQSVATTPKNQVNPILSPENQGKREVFRLSDDVNPSDFNPTPTNQFQFAQQEEETIVLEEQEETKFTFDTEESDINNFSFEDNVEAENYEAPNLFSYDDEQSVSITFDFSETEKNNDTSFLVEEQEVDFQIREQELDADAEPQFFIKEEEPKEEVPVFEMKTTEEPKILEEEPKQEVSFEIEQKEEFVIVEKKVEENPKVMERRNKLKEFNSRYHSMEDNNTFERVPAFRRKNIEINLENASEQRITNFISEENGQTKLRENRFLNKDVD